MVFPVVDAGLEDRAEHRIEPHLAIEGADQAIDHHLVDSGFRPSLGDDARPALARVFHGPILDARH